MPKRRRFTDVPTWCGEPLLVCHGEPEYSFYIDWLANYLYRPHAPVVSIDPKERIRVLVRTVDRAVDAVRAEILDEPPPKLRYPANGAEHADLPFRRDLSRVLSGVPSKKERVDELRWWYTTYEIDCMK
jgi:hypothetical protein